MKAMLALVLFGCALVTGMAQEEKVESVNGTTHRTGMPQDGQIGKQQSFISEAYSWYQSGKVRVFFSADFARALGPFGDGTDYNEEFQAILGRLFRSGVLNGEMFYKEIGILPPAVSHVSASDEELRQRADVFHAMEGYPGPLVKILRYDIVSRSDTHFETITYELWVTSSRLESGWGELHRFRVTTKKRLLLGPKLVKFEYLGMQI
jgi:hypothetical protein